MSHELSLVVTEDGSPTLFSASFDEIYHSRKGAVNESLHVYIRNGLELCQADEIAVLEVGYGTGLNAALAADFAQKRHNKIRYTGIEKYPVGKEQEALIAPFFEPYEWKKDWQEIASATWNEQNALNDDFTFQKVEMDFLLFESTDAFDVIFFDAFAPEKQPQMWELEILEKCFHLLKKGGLLTTYCSKSYIQRNMKAAGFTVTKVPGPIGKREMVVAYKK